MQPDTQNKSPLVKPEDLQPDNSLTGSKIEAADMAASYDNSRKKIKLAAMILGAVFLIIAGVLVIMLVNIRSIANEQPKSTASSQKTNTPQPQPAAAPPSTPTNKYREIDYENGEGRKYKVKYFNDAQIVGYCQVGAYSCTGMSGNIPKTRFLSGTNQGKKTLLFSITKSASASDTNCKAEAFTVTLNNKPTPVCEEGLGGRILYYSFTFTIQGETQVGTFTMDNQKGQAFYDTSPYKDEIKEIIPSIQVYL